VEVTAGATTSTKQFIWSCGERSEQRDASGAMTAQFLSGGETISGVTYLFSKDHLGSVREMTDTSGNLQAEYAFDSFGRITKMSELIPCDFSFASYYQHERSGLNLTVTRAYTPSLGRWLNRDLIQEDGGINLYAYVQNEPTMQIDPSGLWSYKCCTTDACCKEMEERCNLAHESTCCGRIYAACFSAVKRPTKGPFYGSFPGSNTWAKCGPKPPPAPPPTPTPAPTWWDWLDLFGGLLSRYGPRLAPILFLE